MIQALRQLDLSRADCLQQRGKNWIDRFILHADCGDEEYDLYLNTKRGLKLLESEVLNEAHRWHLIIK